MKISANILRSDFVYYPTIAVVLGLSWALGQVSVENMFRTDIRPPLSLFYNALPLLPLLAILPLVIIRSRVLGVPKKRRLRDAYVFLSLLLFTAYSIAAVVVMFLQGLPAEHISVLAVLIILPIGFTMAMSLETSKFDEFHGEILKRTALYSIILTLFFATIWGFMESLTVVPDFPLYMIVSVFFGLFGLVQPFVRRGFK
ncbi:MAG: hypothetical protein COA84_15910 [Robiginitomaculum sp.]|nr:MAG: hypothetical protein COA84_15910 [Robiginitomaculum sp.]